MEGLTAHGLWDTKACVRRLASDATSKQITSVTGHETLNEMQRYTKVASQKRMARDAKGVVTVLAMSKDGE